MNRYVSLKNVGLLLLLIVVNPFNLIAIFAAFEGLAFWGSSNYRFTWDLQGIYKIFGIPTLGFTVAVLGLLLAKKSWRVWQLYVASTILFVITMTVATKVYWSFAR